MIDSTFTQYLLMLGEFEILGHEGLPTFPSYNQHLLYIYFLMATFLT
jgi:hypothetical protein